MDNEIAIKLRDSIKRHEGFRSKMYLDSASIPTIGWGRNIRDVGISQSEADILLNNDIVNATAELYQFLPWTQQLDDVRKAVLVELNFNMGIEKLLQFKKMLADLQAKDYLSAASEMLNSEWAREVGNRAHDLSYIMEKGSF